MEMPSFTSRTSVTKTCCIGTLVRGYLTSQIHRHISEFEDQDDFDNAFNNSHRERNQTLLQFAKVVRAAYLKHDAYGYPLPDRTKGMI